jgi:hypothetical protein
MGFSAIPPKPDEQVLLRAVDMWSLRADAAIMHVSVPYKALLSGTSAATYVRSVDLPLANYFRGKNLRLVVMLDVTDGLNRSAEAPELVQLGRSITEAAVQQVYRQYAMAISATLRPDFLGLAAETNLIRVAAPRTLYDALVRMTNDAAAELRSGGSSSTLFVSVQVETAWGRLPQTSSYIGVEEDFRDFPFMLALGLSSYPYFAFDQPEEIPVDYYARLTGPRVMPVLVVEGGWTSGSVGGIQSSPEKQARYLRRQAALLDSAKAAAVFQLTFTDLDLASFPPQPPGSILALFAQLGLVDSELRPKPVLAVWDSIFARRRAP